MLDKLYIPDNVCLSCNKYFKPTFQGYVCDECIASIKPMLFEKENLPYIDSYRIFSSYDKALKEMIIALKFKKASLFANIIGDIVKADFFAFVKSASPDIVTYVPVSFFRFWQRGYDQNDILLKALNVDYTSIFKRIKHTKPLSLSIDKNQRERIVSGAFKIKKDFVFNLEDKKVLVFDDILTTGATATQIAKTLKMHAVKEVYFYFIASHKRAIDMV
ncbi:MAG TPA: ComF family protein [Hydrogenobaculum sp.]|nr:ComF family protein [Hydrogenobaculum sp.]